MSDIERSDPIFDSHVHWYPREVEISMNRLRNASEFRGSEWSDLEGQLETMDGLGRHVDILCSAGQFSGRITEFDAATCKDLVRQYNELMAKAQRAHTGRVWCTCIVPVQDTDGAIDELLYAVQELGLVGVSLPGSLGSGESLDSERLEPLYGEIQRLGIPIFLHPGDTNFGTALDGYGGALHRSLGRIFDVSTAAFRLILSGIMERYPDLKVVVSHTGGALPYQAGRLDKTSGAKLELRPSAYLKRMFTDTVSPHQLGVDVAVKFFGADHILYGTDYPCRDLPEALIRTDNLKLTDEERTNVMFKNLRKLVQVSRDDEF